MADITASKEAKRVLKRTAQMDCFFMGMATDANGNSMPTKPIPSEQGCNIRTVSSVKQENALYKDALGDTKT